MGRKIFIVGTGAIGKVLAVFLTAAGREVELIKGREDGSDEQILPLQVNLPDHSPLQASVRVSNFSRHDTLDGLVVMANKSIGNEIIAETLSHKCGDSPVILLQNGLDIEQPLVDRNIKHIFRCVLYATSQPLSETSLQFKPVAPSPIGCISGNDALTHDIVLALDTPHFQFVEVKTIHLNIWQKVIANCVFNSICPLLETDNGIFHRDESARLLATEIISECILVATKAGITLEADAILKTVLQISKASEGQLISTYQDIKNQRPTEIESLNFAVVKKAISQNQLNYVTRTKLLGELIKLKSDLNR